MAKQWKLNMDTGKAFLVPSKATEAPPPERQASLELWALEQARLKALTPPAPATIKPEEDTP